jgi:glycosyltransferase involved in cell wall biosynthesis
VTRRILFISKGNDSASTRYRALQFFPLLQHAGYETSHATAAGNPGRYLHALRLAATADIVVVLRKTFPGPLLWLLRRLSRKLVFDFDDAIFCNTDGSPSPTRLRRFAAMASACDHLFAGNRFLADNAAQYNRAVTIVPTCIDTARYAGNYPKPENTVDLVWIGSRSTRKYLVEALPALRMAASRITRLRLKIIADFDLPDAGFPTLAIPWSVETEARELGSSHIGIAPMRDDDWSRGKCALKVLQYMAVGLPVVSSDAGANAEVVLPGETGYLVNNDESCAERITELAEDAVLRDRFGNNGRRRVRAGYSIEPVFSCINGVFRTLS